MHTVLSYSKVADTVLVQIDPVKHFRARLVMKWLKH